MALFLAPAAATAGLFTEPFAGASDFSLLVTGDANLGSGVHVHGGGYVGGNLSVTGSNTSVGSDLPASGLGVFVGGNVYGNQQLALMTRDYYVGGNLDATLQNPGSQLASPPFDAAAVAGQVDAKSAELAALGDTGVVVDSSDTNRIGINLNPGRLNVINWDDISAPFLSNGNANLIFNGFTDDTFLVINYDLGAGGLDFAAKNQGLDQSVYDNLIWNFVGDSGLLVGNTVSTFKGSLLATDSHLDWQANDIDGQLIAESLTWSSNTSQSHLYTPWQADAGAEIPAPGNLLLVLLGSVGLLATRRSPE